MTGIVAFSIGRLSTLADPKPTTTSAEAGFSRDMQVHHHQGVEMAMMVRDLTDDPDVRLLAYDIATTQSQQAGQLYGWLTQWGLKQGAAEPSMTWMSRPALDGGGGHSTHEAAATDAPAHVPGGVMPGMATSAQLTELSESRGVDAEVLFLHLMIAHHKGALEMAESVLERTTNQSVTTFANSVVLSQSSEIDLMNSMLAERE